MFWLLSPLLGVDVSSIFSGVEEINANWNEQTARLLHQSGRR